jgi:predicted transcriptional regulator
MSEALIQDKRQDLRLKEKLPARLRLGAAQDEVFEAETEDISLGGALLKIEIEKKILGKKVLVEIISSPIGKIITTHAEVVWHREEKGRMLAVGLKFLEPAPEDKEEILSLILEKLFPAGQTKIAFKAIDRRLSEKENRALEILDLIRREGPISISKISHSIGVNVVTTTNYLKDYLKKELIIDCGEDVSTGGRRPNLMLLNADFGFCIGLEINHKENFILGTVVNLASKVIARVKEELGPDANRKSAEMILALLKNSRADKQKILGIGLGVDDATRADLLKEYLEKAIGLPVLIKRSSLVGAFAEKWLNADFAEVDNLVYLDSESHCSMIIDGRLYLGASEEAGFIHLPRPTVKEDLFCLISLLNPRVMVIARNLLEEGDNFLKSLREEMRRVLPGITRLPTLMASTLGEDAVALAVSGLCIREILMQL